MLIRFEVVVNLLGTGARWSSEFSALGLELDPATGALLALSDGPWRAGLRLEAWLVTGGNEQRGPVGGLVYTDTERVELVSAARPTMRVDATSRTVSVPVMTSQPERWSAVWHYTFRRDAPRLSVALEVHSLHYGEVLRNVRIDVTAAAEPTADWLVHAPGNRLRPGLQVSELAYPSFISTVGGVDGSVGLVALEHRTSSHSVLVWPLSRTEIGEVTLHPDDAGVRLEWQTDVAGALDSGVGLRVEELLLDLTDRSWAQTVADFPALLEGVGLLSPASPPSWGPDVNLYEVQVGFAALANGYRYAPYPTAQHLLDDLDRIHALGYTALQIMPRQPYPSYNVHDYDDVSLAWGEEGTLRAIVAGCHARGMHVILDILMHGVIDGEALDAALEALRAGPYVDRVGERTRDITTLEWAEFDEIYVSWTRHVLDFEEFWRAGSPRRHRWVDEHPEWFCRDSNGRITGTYTEAFDLAHPGWQNYFIDRCLALMERLGIDGFRFDAPSYNYFHNWSERTRSNAAVSMLGCVPLFERLRAAMRAAHPDSLLYTEPSGLLYRQSMDMNYNYDELWLTRAVLERGAGFAHWVRNAREMAQWLDQRDRTLPPGALTTHHIDSHDSFWWPEPGTKWRRERIGVAATAAFMTTFALSGGPFMTFVGGDQEIEDQVRAVNHLRLRHRCFAVGASDHDAVDADTDDVYAVVRRGETETGLLVVNLSDAPVDCALRVTVGAGGGAVTLPDLLDGEPLTLEDGREHLIGRVALAPFEARAYLLRAAP